MLEWQQRKSDALQDLFDGDFCKTHPLLLKEVSIPIVIYQDDCENPLGSKTAVHRLGCIEHLLSSLQSHFLLAVYKSLDAKTYGLDTVLRPIVEEIQCLERDGITVDTPSFQGVVKFTVVQVVGDNLGLNAMLGYTESFSGNYVCRFCRADKEILRSQTVAGAMQQSASQMWCLLRLLPTMIGDLIPEQCKEWKLLILLLSCMEFIFSPSLTIEATLYLATIIEEHHSLFLELYPHIHLRPKHHFMLHYPRAIQKLGPLIQFWAMRFEAKHNFFKRVSNVTCNFRNICKTMAFRHQIAQCHNLMCGTVMSHNTEVGRGHSTFLANTEGVKDIQIGLAMLSKSMRLISFQQRFFRFLTGNLVHPWTEQMPSHWIS